MEVSCCTLTLTLCYFHEIVRNQYEILIIFSKHWLLKLQSNRMESYQIDKSYSLISGKVTSFLFGKNEIVKDDFSMNNNFISKHMNNDC